MTGATEHIRRCFREFDRDGNGGIDKSELANVLQKLDKKEWTNARITKLFNAMDDNSDGQINYDEFIDWTFDNSYRATRDVNTFRGTVMDTKPSSKHKSANKPQP